MMLDVLAELEQWLGEHKAHSVLIEIDNDYGARCWHVQLSGRSNKQVDVYEVAFFKHDITKLPSNVIYLWDGSDPACTYDDWPGLGATILAAVVRARELGL